MQIPNKRTMLRKPFVAVLILGLVAVIGVGAVAFFGRKEARFPVVTEKVRIGLALQLPSALVILAAEKGFFEEEGLQVETVEYPSGKVAMEKGLFSGEVDVVSAADVPAAIAAFTRDDFNILSAISFSLNDAKIVARNDRGVLKPTDLKGKKIGTQKDSALHYFLHLFLLKSGLDEKDISVSYYPIQELPEALAAGKIDAVTLREPYISRAQRLLSDRVIFFEEPRLYFRNELIIVSDDFLRKAPGAEIKIVRALIHSENYLQNNRQEALEILSKKLSLPVIPQRQEWNYSMCRVELPHSLADDMDNIADWVIAHDVLRPSQKAPNFLDFIRPGALREIAPEAVDLVIAEEKNDEA